MNLYFIVYSFVTLGKIPGAATTYISHVCKISRKLKINSYVINKLFKLQVFCNLKLCIKYKLKNYIVNNI